MVVANLLNSLSGQGLASDETVMFDAAGYRASDKNAPTVPEGRLAEQIRTSAKLASKLPHPVAKRRALLGLLERDSWGAAHPKVLGAEKHPLASAHKG